MSKWLSRWLTGRPSDRLFRRLACWLARRLSYWCENKKGKSKRLVNEQDDEKESGSERESKVMVVH